MSTFSWVYKPYTFGEGGGVWKSKEILLKRFGLIFIIFMWIFGSQKMLMCILFFWGEGVSERMDCTLMKMLTFMDGPLQNLFKAVYYNLAKAVYHYHNPTLCKNPFHKNTFNIIFHVLIYIGKRGGDWQ